MTHTLMACPSCSMHFLRSEKICPHCDAPVQRVRNASLTTVTALLMGLTVTGCPLMQAAYGMPCCPDTGPHDRDDDGYFEADDCNDGDASIHPGAEETAGDGVDSNCDGEDDT